MAHGNRTHSTPTDCSPRRDSLLSAATNQRMFAGIVGRYDLLNRVLSLGLDARWRRLVVQALGVTPDGRYLDLGTGTGDLVLAALRQPPTARWVGVDLALPMLTAARVKLAAEVRASDATLLAADGLRLPFRASSFDGACSAFVIRNVEDRSRLFAEVYRVLRPGARFSVLELTRPRCALLRLGHWLYLRTMVPLAGRALSSASAYRYLAASIERLPDPAVILAEMASRGFVELSAGPLSGGVVTLFSGRKPD